MPLIEQNGLRYRDHADGDVPRFREHACRLGLKGVISKQAKSTLRTWRPRDLGEVQVLGPLKVPKIRSVRPRQPVNSTWKLSRMQWVRPEVVVEVTRLLTARSSSSPAGPIPEDNRRISEPCSGYYTACFMLAVPAWD